MAMVYLMHNRLISDDKRYCWSVHGIVVLFTNKYVSMSYSESKKDNCPFSLSDLFQVVMYSIR